MHILREKKSEFEVFRELHFYIVELNVRKNGSEKVSSSDLIFCMIFEEKYFVISYNLPNFIA